MQNCISEQELKKKTHREIERINYDQTQGYNKIAQFKFEQTKFRGLGLPKNAEHDG